MPQESCGSLEDHPTDQNCIETIRPSNRPSPRLDPIIPLHPASLRLHNLPLSAVEEIPGRQVGRLTKPELEPVRTCRICQRPSTGWERKKPLRPTTSDAGNQLGGELVDAGGSALTATARTARHGRFLELWLRLLARFLYCFNVREKSSMFGLAQLYCESRNSVHTILRTFRIVTLAIRICGGLSPLSPWIGKKGWPNELDQENMCSSQRVTSDTGTGSTTTLLEFIGDSVRASSYQVDLQVHESMLPWILNYTLQSI